MIRALSKDLDVRDRWMGIRQLKSDYNPSPYNRKEMHGKHIPKQFIAEKTQNTSRANSGVKTRSIKQFIETTKT